MKIYLAGKVSADDWRLDAVERLYGFQSESGHILRDAITGPDGRLHDYTGPYFTSFGHGMDYGDNSHGNGLLYQGARERAQVVTTCLQGIQACDIVVAWLDTLNAFGTLAEIGFAFNQTKRIYISGPRRYDDLWFVYEMAKMSAGGFIGPHNRPIDALMQAIAEAQMGEMALTFSPIEAQFYEAWRGVANGNGQRLIPQYEVFGGKYQLDFADPISKTAIELDGYEYHSSKEAFTKDRKRQREIEAAGWRVIRFSGTEVYRNARGCAEEALAFMTGQTFIDAHNLPY